jgi:stalled ribosome rescue protein Dom34
MPFPTLVRQPKISKLQEIIRRNMSSKRYKRGYPIAVLVGLEENRAELWQIYSQVAKHQLTLSMNLNRKDLKATYNFHESIIDALRATLKEGIKSIIVAAPSRTNYAQDFLNHVKAHHSWLLHGTNKASFSQTVGSASTPSQVASLTKTPQFKRLIQETADKETENLLEILEKRLNITDNLVFFSLQEAEKLILKKQFPSQPQPEYLLLTNDYLSNSRQKNRLHRLMQIAQNKKIKTRVIDAESSSGKRLTQLGGIVCLAKTAEF